MQMIYTTLITFSVNWTLSAQWVNQNTGLSGGLKSVHFINDNTGHIVGVNGAIYKTSDGGSSWSQQTSGITYTLNSVFFINANIGVSVGYGNPSLGEGTILRTLDGGANWSVQASEKPLQSVIFINNLTGWAVEHVGTILKTNDAGANWVTQLNGNIDNQFSVSFIDNNTGWTCGNNGTVYKTTNGGVTFVENREDFPNYYNLEQNYPNPFNPSTVISWQSAAGNWQTLKVYDILGNEVATPVDGYKPAGSYEIEFDAGALASGIYFYRINIGEYIETKKM
jgi:photosystem II stability/assembly factor-like uncharacterized protein